MMTGEGLWPFVWGLAACLFPTETAPPVSSDPTLTPRARIETNLGAVVVRLDAEKAPGTVLNFVKYADDKFYDGTVFHRVISDFMIQGGGFTPDLNEKTVGLRPAIRNEWRNGLKNKRGTIAMARLGNQPDSAKASFFINVVNNEFLDKPQDGAAYCVFGAVVEGLETVDKIRQTPVKADTRFLVDRDRPVIPVESVVIQSVRMLDTLDRDRTEKLVAEFETKLQETEAQTKAAASEAIRKRVAELEEKHGKKFTVSPSGLMILDVVPGTGASPSAEGRAKVHYVGTLPDGKVFDDSRTNPDLEDQPADFPVNKVIKGWGEGLLTMKTGGRRILVIPPDLGYGSRGRQQIPPHATLFYEIELLSVQESKPPTK